MKLKLIVPILLCFAIAGLICVIGWIDIGHHRSSHIKHTLERESRRLNDDVSDETGKVKKSQRVELIASELERLLSIGERSCSEVFREIELKSDVNERRMYNIAIATRMINRKFSSLGAVMEYVSDPSEQQSVLCNVIARAFEANEAETFIGIYKQLKNGRLAYALRVAVDIDLDRGNLARAMKTQLTMPLSDARNSAIANIAAKAAVLSTAQSLNWIEQLDDPGERSRAIEMVQYALITSNDINGLKALLPLTVEKPYREALVRAIARDFIKTQNLEGLDELSLSLAPLERGWIEVEQIQTKATDGFEKSILRANEIEQPYIQGRAIQSLIAKEVERNPQRAAEMVFKLPETIRGVAISCLVIEWADRDYQNVTDWMRQLPDGRAKDHTLFALARHLKYRDRAAAQTLSVSVSDSVLRGKLIEELK